MKRRVLMIGTGYDTKGGIASVVNAYREAGLFERCAVHYVQTHGDGPALYKLSLAVAAWFGVVSSLIRWRIGVVHVHVSSRASFWRKLFLSLPCVIAGKPLVLHLHSGEFHVFHNDEAGPLTRCAIQWFFGRADRTIVLSESRLAWMQKAIPNARPVVLHNPVNIPPRARFDERDRHTVLFLGRLGRGKGTYDLIRAIARVVNSFPNVRVLLGGDGEAEKVRRFATELGVGRNVEALGWVVGERKRELLAKCTVFTLPSYNEGQPMSVLEAMAAGAPVLSTRVGGVPDAVRDGVDGVLVEAGDVEALSSALIELLSNEPLRRRVAEAARQRVCSTFSTDVLLPALEAIYDELDAGGGARATVRSD